MSNQDKLTAKQARSKMSSLYIAYVFASGKSKNHLRKQIISLADTSIAARREISELTGGVYMVAA